MKKIIAAIFLTLVFFATNNFPCFAGGPLVVKGGMSITYGTRPFLYRYDQGSLGMFSNAEIIAIIEDLYNDWETVSTTEVNFKRDTPGSLDFDVTAANFDSILNSEDLLGYTPVIFDSDGSLLNAFLGSGAGNSVLGLAGPVTVSSGPLANQIAESQAIFNGRFIDGTDTGSNPESTADSLKGTIIHETGHGIGLDHSQINLEAIKPGATQSIRDTVPLMFPVAVNDLFLIRRDDASAISLLYPNQSQLGSFGKIEGKVFRKDGITPVQGANVIARSVDDPTLEAISCVSDYLTENTGLYTLFAVPPGNYKIEIEPIDLSFTGGSGVGPFTASTTDKSFQNPVPAGFYTGPDKPITTDETLALTVNVLAGQIISDVNIIASTTVGSSSSSSGTAANINEIEPNDSVDQAQSITPPSVVSGQISSSDDGEIKLSSDTGATVIISDLFKFTVSETSSLNALLQIESDSQENDLDLVLLNSDGSDIIDSSSQTGNADELITKTIAPGTYLVGVGAFSGTASYKLTVNAESSGTGTPTLTLTGPETLILNASGINNKVMLVASATNFSAPSKCLVTTSDVLTVKPRPLSFMLSSSISTKKIKVKVKNAAAMSIIESGESQSVTIDVTCTNGANEQFDLLISPTADSVINERIYSRVIKK